MHKLVTASLTVVLLAAFGCAHATRLKQAKAIWKWYEENKDRLAWDKKKRRYYLKPNIEGKK